MKLFINLILHLILRLANRFWFCMIHRIVGMCLRLITHHTATHDNKLQHTATHCNTLQQFRLLACVPSADHTSHCNIRQQTATHCNKLKHTSGMFLKSITQHTATHGKTLQHAATKSNTLQRTTTHCNNSDRKHVTRAHDLAHCNALQHTATRCNHSTQTGGIFRELII